MPKGELDERCTKRPACARLAASSTARVRNEVRLSAARPRDPTQPDVVGAVHRILTDLGLEADVPGLTTSIREEVS